MLQSFGLPHALTGIAFYALLAGCSATQIYTPPASIGALSQTGAYLPSARARMEPTASGRHLLYISDGGTHVYVYTYPQGRLFGTLTGFVHPYGECVDSAGDVFIVTSANYGASSPGIIYEYAHGSTSPIATLNDPNPAHGCAVDNRSGDLAVAGGGVAIFKHASGAPIIYNSWEFLAFYFCGYDNRGNLYISATNGISGNEEQLLRLARGGKALEQISVSVTLYANSGLPSSVQWDGKYITVSSTPGVGGGHDGPVEVYRLRISGDRATVVGTTTLSSKKNTIKSGQVSIEGEHIIGADFFKGQGGVDSWSYPNAGKPRSILPNKVNIIPFGIVVSPAAYGNTGG